MAENINASGTGTVTVSGPGVQATKTITDVNVGESELILLTLTNRVRDANGPFDLYVVSVSAGSLVVGTDKDQLPEELTFNYISVT